MQVVEEDILAAAKTCWDGSPLTSIVTGGLHHGRPPSDTVMPYASMAAETGDREEFSGATYLAKFFLQISVWKANSETAVPAGEIRRQMNQLFDRAEGFVVEHADKVIWVRPVNGRLSPDPKPRDAADVLVLSGGWEILVQATREALVNG